MAVIGWILVDAEVGRARSVCDAIAALASPGVTCLSADTVTGPHDVIVRLRADDLDHLNEHVDSGFGTIPGILDTITCLAVRID
jgi:hypothetical protein